MLSDVQGQDEGVRYLRGIIEGTLTSPLLLIGDAGVGRRFSITEAAKELFREGPPDECPHCYQIDKGTHPDFRVVEPEEEGKEIKVGDIRDLVEKTGVKPGWAPLKFLVIDGADRMTVAASNALLKVLEEAPVTVRFFLIAEEPKRVLPTIRSRCMEIRYRRLPESFVVEKLMELTDDATKALVYCRLADGSVGRAVKFLGSGQLGLRDRMLGLLKTGLSGDISQLFSAVDSVTDLVLGMSFLEHIVHDLVMLPHSPSHLSNVDLVTELGAVRKSLGERRVAKLRSELEVVLPRMNGPYNRSFHVKTMLASSFA